MKYRLTRGKHTRTEGDKRASYEAGASFTPSPGELRAFRDKLEPVSEEDQPETSGAGSAPTYETLGGGWYRLADGTKVHGRKALEKALGEA